MPKGNGYLYKRLPDGTQVSAKSKRRGIYWLQYTLNGERIRQSLETTNREDADKEREKLIAPTRLETEAERLHTIAERADKLMQAAKEARASDVPLSKGWGLFKTTKSWTRVAAKRKRKPSQDTMRQYEVQWYRFVKWAKEQKPEIKALETVTPKIGEAFIEDLLTTRTANTAQKYRNLLSLVWRVLRFDGHTEADDVWSGIPIESEDQHVRRELTTQQLRKVCEAASDELRPLFALGIYTGLRLGDCCQLKWGDVDLATNFIIHQPRKNRGKTTVRIPIHPVLAGILQELPTDSEYVLPGIAEDYIRHTSYVTDQVQKHFQSCGIKTTVERAKGRSAVDVGFHSLRHTFVSLCSEANAPLAVVQAIVGHSNPAMTRHYTHIGDAAAQSAVAALPAVIGEMKEIREPLPVWAVAIVKKMNTKNLKKQKAELLEGIA